MRICARRASLTVLAVCVVGTVRAVQTPAAGTQQMGQAWRHFSKGVSYNRDGSVDKCLFCDFAAQRQAKTLMHEDDSCVAFLPLDISAVQHFLVVPKAHIATVSAWQVISVNCTLTCLSLGHDLRS
jgi:Scavenger mRNA decapping enzyme C-term binding